MKHPEGALRQLEVARHLQGVSRSADCGVCAKASGDLTRLAKRNLIELGDVGILDLHTEGLVRLSAEDAVRHDALVAVNEPDVLHVDAVVGVLNRSRLCGIGVPFD